MYSATKHLIIEVRLSLNPELEMQATSDKISYRCQSYPVNLGSKKFSPEVDKNMIIMFIFHGQITYENSIHDLKICLSYCKDNVRLVGVQIRFALHHGCSLSHSTFVLERISCVLTSL